MRALTWTSGALAAFGLAAAPLSLSAPAAAQSASLPSGADVANSIAVRGSDLAWFGAGENGEAAAQLIELLESSSADGLDPRKYKTKTLVRALRAAQSGNSRAVQRANLAFSQALVAYARDLRRPAGIGVIYVDPELRPAPPSSAAILAMASAAASLEDFVSSLGWMHPLYGQLRSALARGAYSGDAERQRLTLNLERARELPMPKGKHVLVNTAAQRLFMYQDGRVVDSMRVVVGKPVHATPMMAAFIRFTSLNPYWNVPPDLAAERVAPYVIKEGPRYLRRLRYEVLSDWGDSPSVVDPATIDWEAVAAGRVEIRLRQLPGPNNSMGQMKFMFPNSQGIYLHDTPDKELLTEASRLFSGGCVRLQDAPRLAEWLYGKPLNPKGASTEQKVPLPEPVPVYLTYLTAVPSGSSIAWFDDIYGRDAARLAQLSARSSVAAR